MVGSTRKRMGNTTSRCLVCGRWNLHATNPARGEFATKDDVTLDEGRRVVEIQSRALQSSGSNPSRREGFAPGPEDQNQPAAQHGTHILSRIDKPRPSWQSTTRPHDRSGSGIRTTSIRDGLFPATKSHNGFTS